MKIQIIPDINIDNKNTLGLIENIHYYKPLIKRIVSHKDEIEIKKQHIIAYEILITKDNVSFYLSFDDELKDNIMTELNICWPNATFKKSKPILVYGETKELELEEHFFLSLKTDKRGEFPLSNILETQKILRDNEKILIRLEMTPMNHTWYRELEECIKQFNNGKIATKGMLNASNVAYNIVDTALDFIYYVMDFANELISDEKIEHEYVNNNKYSKLIRNGLSNDTKEKSRYNGYKTEILITVSSSRADILFRNILKAFNSMAGDNKFILVDNSKYKSVLSSKELSQIVQMPTKTYQELYKINNISNREIQIPDKISKGDIKIGDVTFKGITKTVYWPNNKNILSLPKIIIGPMGAGKSEYTKNFVIDSAKKGDSVIVLDYIKNCELSNDIANYVNCIKLDLSNKDNLFSLSYPEIEITQDPWQRLNAANMLSRQVEYLINSLSDEPLTSRMSRYLDAAAKVVFIHPNSRVGDVIDVLLNWKIRNEFIRKAKYSGIFTEDDIEIVDLLSLHERDKDDKIVGTRDTKIEGIIDRINIMMKDIYLRTMMRKDMNYNQNFSNWMDEGKVILIQLPEKTFMNKHIKDTIVTYFMSRIWLAALQRKKHDKICHVVTDEIHQIPTAAKLVSNVITEARKFGIDFYFTIHYLRQFRALHDAVRSAGASYMLLAGTEKENLKELEEEIKPFTVQEGLNLKAFHSLSVINIGNEYARFITKLPKPIL